MYPAHCFDISLLLGACSPSESPESVSHRTVIISAQQPALDAQIMKDAKDRQERDAAAANKWQAQEAAKQDARIAAAVARQQRIQVDLEQAIHFTTMCLFMHAPCWSCILPLLSRPECACTLPLEFLDAH